MKRKNFILEEWDSFVTISMQGCPQELRDEMKNVFFAGAAGCFKIMCESSETSTFDAIQRELNEFIVAYRRIAAMKADPPADKPPMDADKMRMIEHMARDAFNTLDDSIGGALNRREIGAALFLFSFIGQELTYVSNAERPDMVKMLHEFLAANPPALTWDEQHG